MLIVLRWQNIFLAIHNPDLYSESLPKDLQEIRKQRGGLQIEVAALRRKDRLKLGSDGLQCQEELETLQAESSESQVSHSPREVGEGYKV